MMRIVKWRFRTSWEPLIQLGVGSLDPVSLKQLCHLIEFSTALTGSLKGPVLCLELTWNSSFTGKKISQKSVSLLISQIYSSLWLVVQGVAERKLVNSVQWCLLTEQRGVQVGKLGSKPEFKKSSFPPPTPTTCFKLYSPNPRTHEHPSSFVLWAAFWPKRLHFSTLWFS